MKVQRLTDSSSGKSQGEERLCLYLGHFTTICLVAQISLASFLSIPLARRLSVQRSRRVSGFHGQQDVLCVDPTSLTPVSPTQQELHEIARQNVCDVSDS